MHNTIISLGSLGIKILTCWIFFNRNLQTSVDKQLTAYWLRVLNKDVPPCTYFCLYGVYVALKLFRRDEYKSQWLKGVKYILDSCGLSYMWYQQQELSTKQCKVIMHQRIYDIALQKVEY